MNSGAQGKPVHALSTVAGIPSVIGEIPQEIEYTDFNKVKKVIQGTKIHELVYGVDQQRIKGTFTNSGYTTLTKYYLGNYEEEYKADGTIRKLHYIYAGNGLAAIMVKNGSVDSLYYTYCDYQGNLLAVTDDQSNVKERLAYDPWGLRRNPDDWTKLDNGKSFLFSRGYTMHEHLDDFRLINMNGRVYDPVMAQFLSPDPFIQAPGNWYNYNRYGYCMNNPLIYNDPTGYKWNWNWLNPVYWLSKGMQYINDNTTGLREKMVDIGVPDFNMGYNSSLGTFHSIGNSGNLYHNQFDPAVNVERGLNQMRFSYGLSTENWMNWDQKIDQGIRGSASLEVASSQGGGYDFGRTNNAFSLAGLGWGINENVWVNNGQWLGKNLKYNSLTWGGNQWTGARSIALKSAKFAKVLGEYAFYVNAAYSLYGVGSGLYTQDYSKAMFFGMSGIYSGVATYGGIPGLVIAGPLVFIDATIGLETYMQNQIDVGIQRGNQISNGNYSMWAYSRFGQSVR